MDDDVELTSEEEATLKEEEGRMRAQLGHQWEDGRAELAEKRYDDVLKALNQARDKLIGQYGKNQKVPDAREMDKINRQLKHWIDNKVMLIRRIQRQPSKEREEMIEQGIRQWRLKRIEQLLQARPSTAQAVDESLAEYGVDEFVRSLMLIPCENEQETAASGDAGADTSVIDDVRDSIDTRGGETTERAYQQEVDRQVAEQMIITSAPTTPSTPSSRGRSLTSSRRSGRTTSADGGTRRQSKHKSPGQQKGRAASSDNAKTRTTPRTPTTSNIRTEPTAGNVKAELPAPPPPPGPDGTDPLAFENRLPPTRDIPELEAANWSVFDIALCDAALEVIRHRTKQATKNSSWLHIKNGADQRRQFSRYDDWKNYTEEKRRDGTPTMSPTAYHSRRGYRPPVFRSGTWYASVCLHPVSDGDMHASCIACLVERILANDDWVACHEVRPPCEVCEMMTTSARNKWLTKLKMVLTGAAPKSAEPVRTLMPGMSCQLRANQYMCEAARERFAGFGITFPTTVSQTVGHNELIRFILIVPTSIEAMNKLVSKKPTQQYLWVKWRIQVLLLKRIDAASRAGDITLEEFARIVDQDTQQFSTPKKTCRDEVGRTDREPPAGGPPPLTLSIPETDDDTSQPPTMPRLDQIDTLPDTSEHTVEIADSEPSSEQSDGSIYSPSSSHRRKRPRGRKHDTMSSAAKRARTSTTTTSTGDTPRAEDAETSQTRKGRKTNRRFKRTEKIKTEPRADSEEEEMEEGEVDEEEEDEEEEVEAEASHERKDEDDDDNSPPGGSSNQPPGDEGPDDQPDNEDLADDDDDDDRHGDMAALEEEMKEEDDELSWSFSEDTSDSNDGPETQAVSPRVAKADTGVSASDKPMFPPFHLEGMPRPTTSRDGSESTESAQSILRRALTDFSDDEGSVVSDVVGSMDMLTDIYRELNVPTEGLITKENYEKARAELKRRQRMRQVERVVADATLPRAAAIEAEAAAATGLLDSSFERFSDISVPSPAGTIGSVESLQPRVPVELVTDAPIPTPAGYQSAWLGETSSTDSGDILQVTKASPGETGGAHAQQSTTNPPEATSADDSVQIIGTSPATIASGEVIDLTTSNDEAPANRGAAGQASASATQQGEVTMIPLTENVQIAMKYAKPSAATRETLGDAAPRLRVLKLLHQTEQGPTNPRSDEASQAPTASSDKASEARSPSSQLSDAAPPAMSDDVLLTAATLETPITSTAVSTVSINPVLSRTVPIASVTELFVRPRSRLRGTSRTTSAEQRFAMTQSRFRSEARHRQLSSQGTRGRADDASTIMVGGVRISRHPPRRQPLARPYPRLMSISPRAFTTIQNSAESTSGSQGQAYNTDNMKVDESNNPRHAEAGEVTCPRLTRPRRCQVSQATQIRAMYAQYQDLPDEKAKWAHAAQLEKATVCEEARLQPYQAEKVTPCYAKSSVNDSTVEQDWSTEKFHQALDRQQAMLSKRLKSMDATGRLFAPTAGGKPLFNSKELSGCISKLSVNAVQYPEPCRFNKQLRGLLKLEDPAFVTHGCLTQLETSVRVLAKLLVALVAKVYKMQKMISQASEGQVCGRLKLEIKKQRSEKLLKHTYIMLAELVVTIVTMRRRAVLRRMSRSVTFHQAALSAPILGETCMFDQLKLDDEALCASVQPDAKWAKLSPMVSCGHHNVVTSTTRRQCGY